MGRDQMFRKHTCGVELDAAALCLELDCNTVFDRSLTAVRGAAAPNRTRGRSGSIVATMLIDGINDLRSHTSSHHRIVDRPRWARSTGSSRSSARSERVRAGYARTRGRRRSRPGQGIVPRFGSEGAPPVSLSAAVTAGGALDDDPGLPG
jgi:hypothetical protein